MYIYFERHPDHALIIVEGDIEGFEQEQFKKPFAELVTLGCHAIIIDLSKVRMLSSLIIGTIIEYWRLCTDAGGNLIILNPSARVRELLEITNLMSRIAVVENRHQAKVLLMKGGQL